MKLPKQTMQKLLTKQLTTQENPSLRVTKQSSSLRHHTQKIPSFGSLTVHPCTTTATQKNVSQRQPLAFTLLLLSILIPTLIFAERIEYNVEILIFEDTAAQYIHSEKWPNKKNQH